MLAAILFFSLWCFTPPPVPVLPDVFLKEIPPPLTDISITINPEALVQQIDAVLDYFQKYKDQDPDAVNAGLLSQQGISLADVETTLRFLKDTVTEDIKNKAEFRLADPQFLKTHFRFFQWLPHPPSATSEAPGREMIKITKYAVFTIKGSLKKNAVFKYALYSLPNDEKGMSLQEAEKHKDRLCRFRYTKRQVLAGAYDQGGVEPLAWVTRRGLEEALMEGTICVELPEGEKRFFNVDRGNDIPFDPTIKNHRHQQRYWYFGRVLQPQGYGLDINSQIPIFSGVTFAGDVHGLGLGKVMGVFYNEPGSGKAKMMLGVLADTGGAFRPNLFQLDYYVGVLNSRKEFNQTVKTLPAFAEVYLLIKK
jgi:hypothetical protein